MVRPFEYIVCVHCYHKRKCLKLEDFINEITKEIATSTVKLSSIRHNSIKTK